MVSKLYYLAWPASTWAAYEAAVRMLSATVDGVERQATAVAGLGDHHRDRRARRLADRLAGGLVPRVAARGYGG